MNFGFLKHKPALPAFHSRNYQLYFTGQGVSLTGTWMTQLATIWIAYDLTHSSLMLGWVGFVRQLPNFVLVPFGGVLVDRWNHHRTLLVTQTLSMLQSFALAVLALTGMMQFWQIIALSLLQGIINAIDSPTRQAFVPELVESRDNLGNAIALNSSMVTGAKLIGPAIGGLLIAGVGAGYCFLIDGFSYLAVLAALLAMRLKSGFSIGVIQRTQPGANSDKLTLISIVQNLQEGFLYAFRFMPIRALLLSVAVISFMGLSPTVVLPIFATQVLHGDAHTLGLLMAAPAVGALIAAAYLSQRQSIKGLERIIAISPLILGISMIVFSLSSVLWLSTLSLVAIGSATLLQNASSNTMLQTIVDDDKRGRVMSFYLMAFLGMASFGNLFTGSLCNLIGAPVEVALSGLTCILVAILFAYQLPTNGGSSTHLG